MEPVDTGVFEGPWVTTDDNGDGTFTTEVVAISQIDNVYFSFTTGEVAVAATPPDMDWHLAFQREHILLNSSIGGPGDVTAAELAGVSFDSVQWAPVDGFAVDLPDDDGDGEDEEVLYTWFAYDYDQHLLEPTNFSFVVRTPDGDVRMTVETYYNDDDGNSGYPKFHWAWLTEPGPLTLEGGMLRADATSKSEWVYVNLDEWIAVAPADPGTSTEWDLALRGAEVGLNGGVSGPGGLSAAAVAAAFDEPIVVPAAKAFLSDAPDADKDGEPERALAGAFLEDGKGVVTPADLTWLIAKAKSPTRKVRFESYENATFEMGHPLVRWAPLD